MDADLLRQRRNLIAISSALLLFDFADVKITKIGILGTDLLVGDVRVLMWSAWFMWLYFLVRYYQYWRTAESQVVRQGFANAEARRARRDQRRKASREGRRIEIRNANGRTYWLIYEQKKDQKPGQIVFEAPQEVPVPPSTIWWWKFRAASDVTLHTTSVTDLILPFVLAVAAPVVTICSHWALISAWIQERAGAPW